MQPTPTLTHGDVIVRPLRSRDARALERELSINWNWLSKWQATLPEGSAYVDARQSIRLLQQSARAGHGIPLVIEADGELVGQVNVSGITHGSLCSASIGYWVSERYAGRNLMPTAVALVSDYCFSERQIHRIEICIRTENVPSLRVVEKLGFRYEGLRRRFIHIDGDWRDHYTFALVSEEIPKGVLHRWSAGLVPDGVALPPDVDREAARVPLLLGRK